MRKAERGLHYEAGNIAPRSQYKETLEKGSGYLGDGEFPYLMVCRSDPNTGIVRDARVSLHQESAWTSKVDHMNHSTSNNGTGTTAAQNQIMLTFADKETADYVRLVCRRKGTGLEGYIVDNFEWDDQPYCIIGKFTWKDCEGCDWSEKCPDKVNKPAARQRRNER